MSTEQFHEVARLDANIIAVRRGARQFADSTEIDRERLRMKLLLDGLGRNGQRLFVDSRHAPTNTDSRWADAFQKLREELARGFERTAVLVTTKVGVLHATRLNGSTQAQGQLAVFDDEAAALQFLRST
jgi:hypothetical protein